MYTTEELPKKTELLNNEKKYNEVIVLLTNELLDDYQNADLYAEKAQAYWRLGKYDLCEEIVNKAIAILPDHSKANNYKGNVYWHKKNYDAAIKYYLKAIETNPNFTTSYNGLAIAYKELRNYDKAVESYCKALEIDPKLAWAYNGLGILYKESKAYDKAIEVYNKSIDINPDYVNSYNGLGNIYWDLKRYDIAIEFYNKAIIVDPKYDASYYNRGLAYQAIEQFTKSLEDYNKYVELTKETPDYYTSLAKSKISDLKKQIGNVDYRKISDLVSKIKNLLLFSGSCVTHYTGVSVSKALILEGKEFRLSEGAFLNDTSEGRELFNFLPSCYTTNHQTKDTEAKPFSPKPFIGSFVADTKHDDLTLWRMYGKENKDEAMGCAITLEREKFIENLTDTLIAISDTETSERGGEEFNFYRVAYKNQNGKNNFVVPGLPQSEVTALNELMLDLQEKIKNYLPKRRKLSDRRNLVELLNTIAYLFKSAEYQYENELRLVVEAIGITKIINFGIPPFRVYINLVSIIPLIRKITIGPKVEKADELASAFYYSLDDKGFHPEILISRLPFK